MFTVLLKNGQTVEVPEEEFHLFLQQNREQIQKRQVKVRRPMIGSPEPAPSRTR